MLCFSVICVLLLVQISGDEPRYDTVVPLWVSIYCSVHFLLVVHGFNELARLSQIGLPYLTVVAIVAYLIFALNNFGLIFDLRYSNHLILSPLYYTYSMHFAPK